jgi:hypothetical protein
MDAMKTGFRAVLGVLAGVGAVLAMAPIGADAANVVQVHSTTHSVTPHVEQAPAPPPPPAAPAASQTWTPPPQQPSLPPAPSQPSSTPTSGGHTPTDDSQNGLPDFTSDHCDADCLIQWHNGLFNQIENTDGDAEDLKLALDEVNARIRAMGLSPYTEPSWVEDEPPSQTTDGPESPAGSGPPSSGPPQSGQPQSDGSSRTGDAGPSPTPDPTPSTDPEASIDLGSWDATGIVTFADMVTGGMITIIGKLDSNGDANQSASQNTNTTDSSQTTTDPSDDDWVQSIGDTFMGGGGGAWGPDTAHESQKQD